MKKLSKHAILLAGVFSAFVTIGTVSSQAQNQTSSNAAAVTQQKMPEFSAEQQRAFAAAQVKAQAEMDRFNKMTPDEQKSYIENAQKQADEQFDQMSKNMSPEQKKVLEAERVKAKSEIDRFNKMTPKQRKVYMDRLHQQMGEQVKSMTLDSQK